MPGQGYTAYSTPYLGLHQIIRPDGLYESQQRFGMYRWHVPDPIRFADRLRVDIQALGWRSGGRYLPRHDDIASTALFYLDAAEPAAAADPDPGRAGDALTACDDHAQRPGNGTAGTAATGPTKGLR